MKFIQRKAKKKYSLFAHNKEMLHVFMSIPPKEKLEWLDYTNKLLSKYAPKRKIKFTCTTKGEIDESVSNINKNQTS